MNRLCLLALLCAGSCQKPKELTSAPLVTKGITGSPVGNGTWNISIDWAAIQAMIPRGCVIAGNPEGVPSGYVLRKGSPEYWCNPKWGRKP